jgi:hypothetical protein
LIQNVKTVTGGAKIGADAAAQAPPGGFFPQGQPKKFFKLMTEGRPSFRPDGMPSRALREISSATCKDAGSAEGIEYLLMMSSPFDVRGFNQ